MTTYIRRIEVKRDDIPSYKHYPFSLPTIKELETLAFHPNVTYIVGENGMGKSTLLEAIAIAVGFNPEGGTLNFSFSTEDSHSDLHEYLRPVRGADRPKDGFFLRAESFYNVASEINKLDRESSLGVPIIESYGGTSLHEQSHGEAFFATFTHRFGGKGLYILDEPEAALSPFRQLSMLSRIHELVQGGSQFIIATHSPILMAYPEATLYNLTENGIEETTLEETSHFSLMKQFVNDKDRLLHHLFHEEQ
ncbi:AAA family ATPase [Priestia taiwanensis]|uniref:ABC transporter ATP-binding protein n=1 Tax=Priestia taiwanensis TaxID=1347902 RepID=A0A917EQ58_9BACI|nr:AAA family ATPase [Priestia taiwanensis]MBM7363913.1 putative ATPase [Priestia taiwanensis]GGE70058.1 ABC transporter ATP-binding protein [Priestia taiwanensis]